MTITHINSFYIYAQIFESEFMILLVCYKQAV